MRSMNRDRSSLDRTLQPTPGCVPIERFAEALTAGETEHLQGCARCQAELALWQEFDASTPSADEGAAVQWVVTELERRIKHAPSAVPHRAWWAGRLPRFAAVAGTLAVTVLIGYSLWDPEPSVRVGQDRPQVYRTVGIRALAPIGDIAVAPRVLEWAPFSGAGTYDVQLLEVDRTVLWHGTAASPRIDLPSAVVSQLVPGKTVLWEVAARNAAGAVVAESGTQRFRVVPASGALRNP